MKQKSLDVRVGEYVQIPCPELKEDKFEAVYWYYCRSENCNNKDTKWSWVAGMNSKGIIKVNDTGRS